MRRAQPDERVERVQRVERVKRVAWRGARMSTQRCRKVALHSAVERRNDHSNRECVCVYVAWVVLTALLLVCAASLLAQFRQPMLPAPRRSPVLPIPFARDVRSLSSSY